MADKKASKSTKETPAQQRDLGRSIFQVIKENAKAGLAGKFRNTVEKERLTRKR